MAEDIYFKISAVDRPGFEARMRALGITSRPRLPTDCVALLDKAIAGKIARDPENATPEMIEAAKQPPLRFQEVIVASFDDPETGKPKLRLVVGNRPQELQELAS